MGTGDGLYHYYRSWHDDPSIPYASIAGHISALEQGRLQERPTEELARERDRLAEGYAEQLSDEQRGPFQRAAGALADGVPVRRGAQVLLRLLVPDRLVQQGPRVRGDARRARLPGRRRGRLPPQPPRGPAGARGARPALGVRRPRARRQPLEADRRAPQGAAGQARRLDPAAGAGHDARGGQRSDHGDAVGDHPRAPAAVGAGRRRRRAARLGGGAGRRRGPGAGDQERRPDRRGPGRRDPRCAAARRRPGRRSSPASSPPSPTSAA